MSGASTKLLQHPNRHHTGRCLMSFLPSTGKTWLNLNSCWPSVWTAYWISFAKWFSYLCFSHLPINYTLLHLFPLHQLSTLLLTNNILSFLSIINWSPPTMLIRPPCPLSTLTAYLWPLQATDLHTLFPVIATDNNSLVQNMANGSIVTYPHITFKITH